NVLHGFERFPHAANAFPHDLACAVRITGIHDVSFTDVVAVYADALGEHIHDAFHRELGLVAAETAHCAADGIVCEDRLCKDVHTRHAVNAGRMAGGS